MFAFTIASCISCADEHQVPSNLSAGKLQTLCVFNLFRNSQGMPIDLATTQFISGKATERTGTCDWLGVECSEGEMTSLIVYSEILGSTNAVDTRWLPPTLQFVLLHGVNLLNVVDETSFSRDAVFVEFILNDYAVLDSRTLSRLPKKIEELLLLGVALSGPLVLTKLPQSMRVVYLLAERMTFPIFIDSEALPKALKNVHVCFEKGSNKAKKIHTFGRKRDSRFSIGFRRAPLIEHISAYDGIMMEKAKLLNIR